MVRRDVLGAVAGAAQRPKRSVFATLDATGAGSWAAATPKRVTPMTAEIIGGGACKYTFVVVKKPQIRARLGLFRPDRLKA